MIKVLIQAEAGSSEKIRYDERTLKRVSSGRVCRLFPYPYGFVLDTIAADGDNADCYVFGDDKLKSGSIVSCEVVGLLHQTESGEPDHKVLAVVAGQKLMLPHRALEVLQDFIYSIFIEYPNTNIVVGPIHSRDLALQYILDCQRRWSSL